MKKRMVLLGLAVSCAAWGYEELRTFAMADGSVFDAVVVSCDSLEDSVVLASAEGNLITSAKSSFSAADQEFLTEREMQDLFLSPTDFVIVPTRWTYRRWAEEPVGEYAGEADPAQSGSEYRYSLTMFNLGGIPLENLTVVYRISYQQPASDEAAVFALQNESQVGSAEISSCVDGSIPVDALGIGEWKTYTTAPVSVSGINSALSSSQIEISVLMQMPDGTVLTREVALPGT